MKKYFAALAAFMLMSSLLTGCRGPMDDTVNDSTGDTMKPIIEDTIDPTNGANRETGPAKKPTETTEHRNETSPEQTENGAAGEDTPARGRRRMLPIH